MATPAEDNGPSLVGKALAANGDYPTGPVPLGGPPDTTNTARGASAVEEDL